MSESDANAPAYPFYGALARAINAGQTRSVLLWGGVHDLFFVAHEAQGGGSYEPLLSYLHARCGQPGIALLVYELNGPIRMTEDTETRLRDAWCAWQLGRTPDDLVLHSIGRREVQRDRERLAADFDRHQRDAIGRPTVALEFMRQLTNCSRAVDPSGRPYFEDQLMIFIEAADLLVPAGKGDIASLSAADRHRITILQDWFGDPGFLDGDDAVVMLAESRSLVHPRVTQLPSVLEIEVSAPTLKQRREYINHTVGAPDDATDHRLKPEIEMWGTVDDLAAMTAGLSIHALRQLLLGARHTRTPITPDDVIERVQDHIAATLGEDVVEFKKPHHTLDDVVGFTKLKAFLKEELLPRFRAGGAAALPGAAVAGPIGGGKTFIFEAAASDMDLPVLVIKNIRSQWFGQTDVIFERLRRVLEALDKVIIFVDEADTQFGGIGPETHATERRLTGKIQQMMSDPRLRGRVIWLLMTARIHLLSPDIRRPGRVGDLIIPVLDPEDEDRDAFIRWTVGSVIDEALTDDVLEHLRELTVGYSAAAYASLRSALRAREAWLGRSLTVDDVQSLVHDLIPPAIGPTRRYQTLQALLNCTRRSLLPDPDITDEDRQAWREEIRRLELHGIS